MLSGTQFLRLAVNLIHTGGRGQPPRRISYWAQILHAYSNMPTDHNPDFEAMGISPFQVDAGVPNFFV